MARCWNWCSANDDKTSDESVKDICRCTVRLPPTRTHIPRDFTMHLISSWQMTRKFVNKMVRHVTSDRAWNHLSFHQFTSPPPWFISELNIHFHYFSRQGKARQGRARQGKAELLFLFLSSAAALEQNNFWIDGTECAYDKPSQKGRPEQLICIGFVISYSSLSTFVLTLTQGNLTFVHPRARAQITCCCTVVGVIVTVLFLLPGSLMNFEHPSRYERRRRRRIKQKLVN